MGRHKNTMYPKIFVKIPALDDSELTHTIENAIQQAAYPERLVFSICLTYSQSVAREELEAYLDRYSTTLLNIVWCVFCGCRPN